MKRPGLQNFQAFADRFADESKKAGRRQYLVPYFISAHPGCDLKAMIDLAVFLKRNGYKPEQVCRISSPPRSTSPRACITPAWTR
jgi:radical SAM superfamily enzyme YgiQ (UPF0313 family)